MRFLCVVALVALAVPVQAQIEGVLRPDDEVHAFLDRQATLGRLDGVHLSARPLSALAAREALDTLAVRGALSGLDSVRLGRLRGRIAAPAVPALRRVLGGAAYRDGRNLYAVRDTALGYALTVNPIADLRLGVGRQTRGAGRVPERLVYTGSRGIRTAGHLGRFFFESRVEEIQEQPLRRRDTFSRLPRERNIDVLDGQDSLGRVSYDYGRVAGVVGYRSGFFEARFGRDRHRLGEAQGSLHLSDYAPVYDHLQLRTTVWRLQYTNLFAAMEVFPAPSRDRALQRKYGAFHQLALSLPGRVNLQLFEGVVYLPDVESGRTGYDVSFLNPIIFYRHVEDSFNRRGNKELGLGASWIPVPGVKVYGQALLTEFKASELFSDAGWWGNKWGALGGVHLADPGLRGLDVVAEAAAVRPYTYSHHENANATHFRDVLGFPAGQNLYDLALRTRYRPTPSLLVRADAWLTQRGRDSDSTVVGGDPLRSYNDRSEEYDVRFLDGVRVDEVGVEAEVALEALPGLFVGAFGTFTLVDDAETGLYRALTASALLRWGLPFPSRRY